MLTQRPRLGIVDLDFTLLKTRAFCDQLAHVMGEFPGIEPNRFNQEIRWYDRAHAGYDLPRHLEDYGLGFTSIRPFLITTLSRHDFLYPDAVKFCGELSQDPDTDLWLLTSGISATQELKLELAFHELQRRLKRRYAAPAYQVIPGNKGRFLNRLFTAGLQVGSSRYHRAFVVDDNPTQLADLQPQPGLEIYQIVRVDDEHKFASGARPDISAITSLTELLSRSYS